MAAQKIWAVFGDTAATGPISLSSLLQKRPANVQLTVQVKPTEGLSSNVSLLAKAVEGLEFSVRVIKGSPTDAAALDEYLDGVDVIVLHVGRHRGYINGVTSSKFAGAVISSLGRLRYQHHKLGTVGYKTPTVIHLRCTSRGSIIPRRIPTGIRKIIRYCIGDRHGAFRCTESLFMAASTHKVYGEPLLRYRPMYLRSDQVLCGGDGNGYKLILDAMQEKVLYDIGMDLVSTAGDGLEHLSRSTTQSSAYARKSQGKGRISRELYIPESRKRTRYLRQWRLYLLGGMSHMGLAIGTLPGSTPILR